MESFFGRFFIELGNRVPATKLEDLLRLLRSQPQNALLFIEFWSFLERTISDGSDKAGIGFDDVECLRLLRDQILNELARFSGLSTAQISHVRLMSILHSVRERAATKATWDEAIQSSSGSGVRMHSISAISGAIKVMLEEYLQSSESDEEEVKEIVSLPPPTPPRVAETIEAVTPRSVQIKHDELQNEVDELKSKLTETECTAARLVEDKLALERSKTEEVSKLKKELDSANLKLSELKTILSQDRDEITRLTDENGKLQDRVSQLEIPLDISLTRGTTIPTPEEWRAVLLQLNRLQQALGEEKAVLLSQIQTLEVQKNDAEAELTRIRASRPPPAPPSVSGSVYSSNRKFCVNTVSVHGTETSSTRRSSVAEQFVDLAPPNRTVLHVDGYTKPKSSVRKKSSPKTEQCVQQ